MPLFDQEDALWKRNTSVMHAVVVGKAPCWRKLQAEPKHHMHDVIYFQIMRPEKFKRKVTSQTTRQRILQELSAHGVQVMLLVQHVVDAAQNQRTKQRVKGPTELETVPERL